MPLHQPASLEEGSLSFLSSAEHGWNFQYGPRKAGFLGGGGRLSSYPDPSLPFALLASGPVGFRMRHPFRGCTPDRNGIARQPNCNKEHTYTRPASPFPFLLAPFNKSFCPETKQAHTLLLGFIEPSGGEADKLHQAASKPAVQPPCRQSKQNKEKEAIALAVERPNTDSAED